MTLREQGKNEVFKLARARERRTRDLSGVRFIKDEDGRVIVEDAKVQERWRGYFCKFFNGEDLNVPRHIKHLAKEEQQHYTLSRPITK